MVKKYMEVTIVLEDDPAVNPTGILEVSSREKEGDAGVWSDPNTADCIPHSTAYFPWLKLDIEKIEGGV